MSALPLALLVAATLFAVGGLGALATIGDDTRTHRTYDAIGTLGFWATMGLGILLLLT